MVTEKRSNLDLLKDWGRMRLKQLKNIEPTSSAAVKLRDKGRVGLARRKWDKDEPVHSSSGNWSASSESGQSTSTSHIPRYDQYTILLSHDLNSAEVIYIRSHTFFFLKHPLM